MRVQHQPVRNVYSLGNGRTYACCCNQALSSPAFDLRQRILHVHMHVHCARRRGVENGMKNRERDGEVAHPTSVSLIFVEKE